MKFKYVVFLSVLAFLMTSCATTYPIKSDYEKAVDFSDFKTFQIVKQENGFPLGANLINKQRIERAILKEMSVLNFSESTEPDLLLSWFVAVQTVRDVDIYRNYYQRWRSRDWVEIYEYKEGTLVIDLIDKSNNQVVWHGATKGRVYENMPKIEEKINQAVKAILERFAEDAKLNKELAFN